MKPNTRQNTSSQIVILMVSCVLFTTSLAVTGTHAADKKDVQKAGKPDKGSLKLPKLKDAKDADPTLKIYVNKHGSYIDGKSVAADNLTAVVKKMKVKRVLITAEPDVLLQRVTVVMHAVQKAGVANISLATAKKPVADKYPDQTKPNSKADAKYSPYGKRKPDAEASPYDKNKPDAKARPYDKRKPESKTTPYDKSKPKAKPESKSADYDKLREILLRQKPKGSRLDVYLKSRAAYVNGKSVTNDELLIVVRKARPEQVVLTAEANVPADKLASVKEVVRQAGVKQVKWAKPKQADGKRKE